MFCVKIAVVMADFNIFKLENNFENGFWSSIKKLFMPSYSKENVNILFIDDLEMPVVENLKRAGYRVKKVKDIKNIDDAEVRNSQIIFVDFEGVGRAVSSQHQGAGLVKELKKKYLKSKYIVLYTSQMLLPSDTIMKSFFDYADARLKKDDDETEFLSIIDKALKEIR